ncbi:NAD-dependent epimerase/dehydratase family protein [Ekhidna sp.]|uniref:NAD-dependent epimerase/dehydratase family protein n=1 Tax=Ekhidna sp. TaxID=2608089 RepID=UPI003296C4DD
MSGKKAVVIGATGLVGRQLIRLMIKDDRYETITIITRRPHEIKDPKLVELIVEDFDKLQEYQSSMNAHDFYCTLGTTRKKAGSKEAFLKVDVEYPIEFAKIAKSQLKFQQLSVVTAVGANSSSPLFYNMAKGELEDKLQGLNLKALKIFQPSLLLGKRKESRFIEEVAKIFSAIASFFTIASKKRVGAIRDVEVAKAMIEVAKKEEEGFCRYKPGQMVDIAYSV